MELLELLEFVVLLIAAFELVVLLIAAFELAFSSPHEVRDSPIKATMQEVLSILNIVFNFILFPRIFSSSSSSSSSSASTNKEIISIADAIKLCTSETATKERYYILTSSPTTGLSSNSL